MISVVICTYNGKSRLSTCFASLSSQRNAPEFEVLLIDNASNDGTGKWASEVLASYLVGVSWRVIKEDRVGLLYARLAGLNAAFYPWVLFCDDDNILTPDFLQKAQEVLSSDPKLGVLGSLGIPEFLGQKPEWFDRYSSSFAVGPQTVNKSGNPRLDHVFGACSIYRKEPLIELFQQGFSPVLSGRKGKELSAGDDVEWCWIMQLMGYNISYSDLLKFKHCLPASRLEWPYYLKLKRGISSSPGLLTSYTYYFGERSGSLVRFAVHYFLQASKSVLRYTKHRVMMGVTTHSFENQVSLTILHAQMHGYLRQGLKAMSHYRQLIRYFGV